MINKESAILVKSGSLKAVEDLSRILLDIRHQISDEDFDRIKRQVGSVIGRIQGEILSDIYLNFPDLNDLDK